MNKRYLGSVLLTPLVIFLVLGGMWLKGLIFLIAIIGLYEFYKASKEKNINPLSVVGYTLCVIYYLNLSDNPNYRFIILFIIAFVFIMFCIPLFNDKYNYIDIAVTLLGFLYVAVFLSFIVIVNLKEYGQYLVWLIFISSWMCDTTAYYVGRYFGKNKLCPKLSPKKTIEGSIGGLIGSIVYCGIFGLIANKYGGIGINMYNYLLIGLLSGGFSQVGDLAASSIKRYVGIKDYGNIIPGHGGILDRFDSILFSAVVVYYYLTFVIGI